MAHFFDMLEKISKKRKKRFYNDYILMYVILKTIYYKDMGVITLY